MISKSFMDASNRILHVGSDVEVAQYLNGRPEAEFRAATLWCPAGSWSPPPTQLLALAKPTYVVWELPLGYAAEAVESFRPDRIVVDLYSYEGLAHVKWASNFELPLCVSYAYWPITETEWQHTIDTLRLASQCTGSLLLESKAKRSLV